MSKDVSREIEEFQKELEQEIKKIEKEVEQKYSKDLVKKIEEYVERYLASSGINQVLILDFVLPSVDLKSRTIRIEQEGRIITRERKMSSQDLQRISSLRTRFYQILRAYGAFKIGEKTWAILPGHEKRLVREANDKLKEMNQIIMKYNFPPRTLNLIEIFAPTRWVIEKLEETINKYKQDLDIVIQQMKQEELEEKKRRLLATKASKLRKIIENLEKQLVELVQLEEKRAKQYIADEALGKRTVKGIESRNKKKRPKLKESLGRVESIIREKIDLENEELEKRASAYINI